jgi:hypothetical protein
VFVLLGIVAQAAEPTTKLYSRSGSKMRIEGGSNIHDWQMENTVIQGSLEAGSNFPLEPGQAATVGKAEAHVDISINVKGFRSYNKDGSPYDPAMDDRMYQGLKAEQNPKITFHLTELVLKQPAATKDTFYLFEAKGELAVAGVTNTISMPVNSLPLGESKLKISGSAAVKMTDFKIDPPTKLGVFKTDDQVKLIFVWMVAPRTTPAAPATNK